MDESGVASADVETKLHLFMQLFFLSHMVPHISIVVFLTKNIVDFDFKEQNPKVHSHSILNPFQFKLNQQSNPKQLKGESGICTK